MKRGKEEEKITGPMFPRLHVNDTDKGGPRAPPRNKMALYEQFSIPSQRFSSTATSSVLPLPPHNASNPTSSASSSQACQHQRSVFSSFYAPHTPAPAAEKALFQSDGMNVNLRRKESDKRSLEHMNNSDLKGREAATECSSQHPREFYKPKSSCLKKKLADNDDFRVPTFVESRNVACLNNGRLGMGVESLTPFCGDSPKKKASEKTSRQNEQNSEQSLNTVVIKKHKKQSASHSEIGERVSEPNKNVKAPSDLEHTSTINNPYENSPKQGTGHYQKACDTGLLGGQRCSSSSDLLKNGDVLEVRNESYFKASLRDDNRNKKGADSCNQESDDKTSGSLELEDAGKKDDVSEGSMVDSVSGLEISPDDVVGVIGPKQFWKARRAIINQQRVFARQVFELHRLIKVQKLIAASPHILIEDYACIDKSLCEVPAKKLSAECNKKSELQIVKDKDDIQKPNNDFDLPEENIVQNPLLPSHDNVPDRGLCQSTRSVAYSRNSAPVAAAPENKINPWCFYPPANQWLVPVLSPSEGLIYKPYLGPCPPTGYVAPVYGSCAPLNLSSSYGVPASNQLQNMGGVVSGASAIAPQYFPTPYGVPVVNPVISTSAVEQVSPVVGSQAHGQTQTNQHSPSSCNMSNQKNESSLGRIWRLQGSKNSEIQGSTASSFYEKAQGEGRDALPPFPMAQAAEASTQLSESCDRDNNQHQVIKVVPHNARSATESAVRILRSIQKERQQVDD